MWDEIVSLMNFTGIVDKTVWQDVIISSFLIPLMIFLFSELRKWWDKTRPSHQILKDYIDNDTDIYIFHSQMSAADENFNLKSKQNYISRFPQPIPSNSANLGAQKKFNIDPVSSGADGECVATIFNILGLVQKTRNIHIGDIIRDWGLWAVPMFLVGFNPKTEKIIERGVPIDFEMVGSAFKIKNSNISYGCIFPDDAGVIQKTFDRDFDNPIFILAGLGTTGTSAAGLILKNNFVSFGKLFGNDRFCVFLKAKIDEGNTSASIQKIVPKPKWYRIFIHPLLYFSFKNKDYFKLD